MVRTELRWQARPDEWQTETVSLSDNLGVRSAPNSGARQLQMRMLNSGAKREKRSVEGSVKPTTSALPRMTKLYSANM